MITRSQNNSPNVHNPKVKSKISDFQMRGETQAHHYHSIDTKLLWSKSRRMMIHKSTIAITFTLFLISFNLVSLVSCEEERSGKNIKIGHLELDANPQLDPSNPLKDCLNCEDDHRLRFVDPPNAEDNDGDDDDLNRSKRSSPTSGRSAHQQLLRVTNPGATTTFYNLYNPSRTQQPLGLLTTTIGSFQISGTTTEYVTKLIGTVIKGTYAQIQSTSSKVYQGLGDIEPTSIDSAEFRTNNNNNNGFIGSTVNTEINGYGTTVLTTEFYRNLVDGTYRQELSTYSTVHYPEWYTDAILDTSATTPILPTAIYATPVLPSAFETIAFENNGGFINNNYNGQPRVRIAPVMPTRPIVVAKTVFPYELNESSKKPIAVATLQLNQLNKHLSPTASSKSSVHVNGTHGTFVHKNENNGDETTYNVFTGSYTKNDQTFLFFFGNTAISPDRTRGPGLPQQTILVENGRQKSNLIVDMNEKLKIIVPGTKERTTIDGKIDGKTMEGVLVEIEGSEYSGNDNADLIQIQGASQIQEPTPSHPKIDSIVVTLAKDISSTVSKLKVVKPLDMMDNEIPTGRKVQAPLIQPSKPTQSLPTYTVGQTGESQGASNYNEATEKSSAEEANAKKAPTQSRTSSSSSNTSKQTSPVFQKPTPPSFGFRKSKKFVNERSQKSFSDFKNPTVEPSEMSNDLQSAESSNSNGLLATVTYVGFADFTTTVGNTVIVFMPRTRMVEDMIIRPSKTVSSSTAKIDPTRYYYSTTTEESVDDKVVEVVVPPTSPPSIEPLTTTTEEDVIEITTPKLPTIKSGKKAPAPNQVSSSKTPILPSTVLVSAGTETVLSPSLSSSNPPTRKTVLFPSSSRSRFFPRKTSVVPSPALTSATTAVFQTDKSNPTGLVSSIGGSIVRDNTTTLFTSLIIGTFIDSSYAQVIKSTSTVFFQPTMSIEPTPVFSNIVPESTPSVSYEVTTSTSSTTSSTTESSTTTAASDEPESETTTSNPNYERAEVRVTSSTTESVPVTTPSEESEESPTTVPNDSLNEVEQARKVPSLSLKNQEIDNQVPVLEKPEIADTSTIYVTRTVPTTVYRTYTYFTTFFIPQDEGTTVSSVVSREVTSTAVGFVKKTYSSTIAPTPTSTTEPTTSLTKTPEIDEGVDDETMEDDEYYTPGGLDNDIASQPRIVYKTYFTTYTYLTTFFTGETSSVSSREEVISSIVTLTQEPSIRPTPSVASSSIQPTQSPSISPSESSGEESEEEPVPSVVESTVLKTFFTTYTYFSTLFNGPDSSPVTKSRIEVITNIVSTTVKSTIAPTPSTSSKIDVEPTASVTGRKVPEDLNSVGSHLNEHRTNEPTTMDYYELESSEGTTTIPKDSILADELIKHEDDNEEDDEFSSVEPTPVLKTLFTTFSFFTTYYKGGTSSVATRLQTVTNVVTENGENNEQSTMGTEEIMPSVFPITYLTTFTYWTTHFKDNSAVVTSREETISNVVTPGIDDIPPSTQVPEPIQPTQTVEYREPKSLVPVPEKDLEPSVPPTEIELTTFFTTYTYFTSSYIGDQTIVNSRFETVTNIVTGSGEPEITPSTVTPIASEPEQTARVIGDLPAPEVAEYDLPVGLLSTIVNQEVIDKTTVQYSTDVYGTFIDGIYAQVLESTSRIINPTSLSEMTNFLPDATATPIGLLSVNSGSTVEGAATTIYKTEAFGTQVDGTYAQVLKSSSSVISSESNEDQSSSEQKTGLVRVIDGSKVAPNDETTTYYTSSILGTIIDGQYGQIIESTTRLVVNPTATETLVRPSSAVVLDSSESAPTEEVPGATTEDSSPPSTTPGIKTPGKFGSGLRNRRPNITPSSNSFTPLITPFAGRSRSSFAPRKKSTAAVLVTRTEITPTVTATLAPSVSRGSTSFQNRNKFKRPGSESESSSVLPEVASTTPRLPFTGAGRSRFQRPQRPGVTSTNASASSSETIQPSSSSAYNPRSSSSSPRSRGSISPKLSSSASGNRGRSSALPTASSSNRFSGRSRSGAAIFPTKSSSTPTTVKPTAVPQPDEEYEIIEYEYEVPPGESGPAPSSTTTTTTPEPPKSTGATRFPNNRFRINPKLNVAALLSTTTSAPKTTSPKPRRTFTRPTLASQRGTTPRTTSTTAETPEVEEEEPVQQVVEKEQPSEEPEAVPPPTKSTKPLNPLKSLIANSQRPQSTRPSGRPLNRHSTTTTTPAPTRPTTTRRAFAPRARPSGFPSRGLIRGGSSTAATTPEESPDSQSELEVGESRAVGNYTIEPVPADSAILRDGSEFSFDFLEPLITSGDESSAEPSKSEQQQRRRRSTRQVDYGTRQRSVLRSNLKSRPQPVVSNARSSSSSSDYDADDVEYYYYDEPSPPTPKTTTTTTTTTTPKPSSRGSSRFRGRISPSPTSTSPTRQFTLTPPSRGTSSPATSGRTSFTPRRSKSLYNTQTTTSPPRSRFRSRYSQFNSLTTTTTTTPKPRSRFSSATRNRGSSRYNYEQEQYIQPEPIIEAPIRPDLGTITVTHFLPSSTTIPVVHGQSTEYKSIIIPSPSVELLAPYQYIYSTHGGRDNVLAIVNQLTTLNSAGQSEVTTYLIRESLTSSITFTPTTIRGRRTSFSHILPSTVYTIEPVVSTVHPLINPENTQQQLTNLLLSQLLGNLGLGNLQNQQQLQQFPQQSSLVPGEPVTNYNTITTSYVTTITDYTSTIIPITLFGKVIKTTVVESSVNILTATEYLTESTVITPTIVQAPLIQTLAQPQQQLNNNQNALLLQQLLAQQQQQLANNVQIQPTKSAQLSLLPTQVEDPTIDRNTEELEESPDEPQQQYSVVTLYVSGKMPGEFSTVLSTVRAKRSINIHPSSTSTIVEPSDTGVHNFVLESSGSNYDSVPLDENTILEDPVDSDLQKLVLQSTPTSSPRLTPSSSSTNPNNKKGRLYIHNRSTNAHTLATKIMSNGVEVIVKTNETGTHHNGNTAVAYSVPFYTHVITLPPTTVSNQFHLIENPGVRNTAIDHLLHSIVRSAIKPEMVTKTMLTTFTLLHTVLMNQSTTVLSKREETISNTFTSKYSRPPAPVPPLSPTNSIQYVEYTPYVKADNDLNSYNAYFSMEPSLMDPDYTSSYLTDTLTTIYTYYNTFVSGSLPVVLTSSEIIENIVTIPAYFLGSPMSSSIVKSQSRIFETETYYSTFTFSKTIYHDSTRSQVLTTKETLTQVVVTEAVVPVSKTIQPSVKLEMESPTLGPIVKTYYTTFTTYLTTLEGNELITKSRTTVTSNIVTPTHYQSSLVGPVESTPDTNHRLKPIMIYATKTYYTTTTYYTSILEGTNGTQVHSRTQVVSTVVTEAISTVLNADYLLALKSEYLAHNDGDSALNTIQPSETSMYTEPTIEVRTIEGSYVPEEPSSSILYPHWPKDENVGLFYPEVSGNGDFDVEMKSEILNLVNLLTSKSSSSIGVDDDIIAPSKADETGVYPTGSFYGHLFHDDVAGEGFGIQTPVHTPTPPLQFMVGENSKEKAKEENSDSVPHQLIHSVYIHNKLTAMPVVMTSTPSNVYGDDVMPLAEGVGEIERVSQESVTNYQLTTTITEEPNKSEPQSNRVISKDSDTPFMSESNDEIIHILTKISSGEEELEKPHVDYYDESKESSGAEDELIMHSKIYALGPINQNRQPTSTTTKPKMQNTNRPKTTTTTKPKIQSTNRPKTTTTKNLKTLPTTTKKPKTPLTTPKTPKTTLETGTLKDDDSTTQFPIEFDLDDEYTTLVPVREDEVSQPSLQNPVSNERLTIIKFSADGNPQHSDVVLKLSTNNMEPTPPGILGLSGGNEGATTSLTTKRPTRKPAPLPVYSDDYEDSQESITKVYDLQLPKKKKKKIKPSDDPNSSVEDDDEVVNPLHNEDEDDDDIQFLRRPTGIFSSSGSSGSSGPAHPPSGPPSKTSFPQFPPDPQTLEVSPSTGINWKPLLKLGAVGLGGLGASTLTKLSPLWSSMAGYLKSGVLIPGIARNDTQQSASRPYKNYNRLRGPPYGPVIEQVPYRDTIPRRPVVTHANNMPNFRPIPDQDPTALSSANVNNFRYENKQHHSQQQPLPTAQNFHPPNDAQPNIFTQMEKPKAKPTDQAPAANNEKIVTGNPMNFPVQVNRSPRPDWADHIILPMPPGHEDDDEDSNEIFPQRPPLPIPLPIPTHSGMAEIQRIPGRPHPQQNHILGPVRQSGEIKPGQMPLHPSNQHQAWIHPMSTRPSQEHQNLQKWVQQPTPSRSSTEIQPNSPNTQNQPSPTPHHNFMNNLQRNPPMLQHQSFHIQHQNSIEHNQRTPQFHPHNQNFHMHQQNSLENNQRRPPHLHPQQQHFQMQQQSSMENKQRVPLPPPPHHHFNIQHQNSLENRQRNPPILQHTNYPKIPQQNPFQANNIRPHNFPGPVPAPPPPTTTVPHLPLPNNSQQNHDTQEDSSDSKHQISSNENEKESSPEQITSLPFRPFPEQPSSGFPPMPQDYGGLHYIPSPQFSSNQNPLFQNNMKPGGIYNPFNPPIIRQKDSEELRPHRPTGMSPNGPTIIRHQQARPNNQFANPAMNVGLTSSEEATGPIPPPPVRNFQNPQRPRPPQQEQHYHLVSVESEEETVQNPYHNHPLVFRPNNIPSFIPLGGNNRPMHIGTVQVLENHGKFGQGIYKVIPENQILKSSEELIQESPSLHPPGQNHNNYNPEKPLPTVLLPGLKDENSNQGSSMPPVDMPAWSKEQSEEESEEHNVESQHHPNQNSSSRFPQIVHTPSYPSYNTRLSSTYNPPPTPSTTASPPRNLPPLIIKELRPSTTTTTPRPPIRGPAFTRRPTFQRFTRGTTTTTTTTTPRPTPPPSPSTETFFALAPSLQNISHFMMNNFHFHNNHHNHQFQSAEENGEIHASNEIEDEDEHDHQFGQVVSGSEDNLAIIDPVNQKVIKSPFDKTKPTPVVSSESDESTLLKPLKVSDGFFEGSGPNDTEFWWPSTYKPQPLMTTNGSLEMVLSTSEPSFSSTLRETGISPTTYRPSEKPQALLESESNQIPSKIPKDDEGLEDVKLKNVEIHKVNPNFVKRPDWVQKNPHPVFAYIPNNENDNNHKGDNQVVKGTGLSEEDEELNSETYELTRMKPPAISRIPPNTPTFTNGPKPRPPILQHRPSPFESIANIFRRPAHHSKENKEQFFPPRRPPQHIGPLPPPQRRIPIIMRRPPNTQITQDANFNKANPIPFREEQSLPKPRPSPSPAPATQPETNSESAYDIEYDYEEENSNEVLPSKAPSTISTPIVPTQEKKKEETKPSDLTPAAAGDEPYYEDDDEEEEENEPQPSPPSSTAQSHPNANAPNLYGGHLVNSYRPNNQNTPPGRLPHNHPSNNENQNKVINGVTGVVFGPPNSKDKPTEEVSGITKVIFEDPQSRPNPPFRNPQRENGQPPIRNYHGENGPPQGHAQRENVPSQRYPQQENRPLQRHPQHEDGQSQRNPQHENGQSQRHPQNQNGPLQRHPQQDNGPPRHPIREHRPPTPQRPPQRENGPPHRPHPNLIRRPGPAQLEPQRPTASQSPPSPPRNRFPGPEHHRPNQQLKMPPPTPDQRPPSTSELEPPPIDSLRLKPSILELPSQEPIRYPGRPENNNLPHPNLLRPDKEIMEPDRIKKPVKFHTVASVDDENKIIGTHLVEATRGSVSTDKIEPSRVVGSSEEDTNAQLVSHENEDYEEEEDDDEIGEDKEEPDHDKLHSSSSSIYYADKETSVVKYTGGSLKTVSFTPTRTYSRTMSRSSTEPIIQPTQTRDISSTINPTSTPGTTTPRTHIITRRPPFTRPTPKIVVNQEQKETTSTSFKPFIPIRNPNLSGSKFPPWLKRKTTTTRSRSTTTEVPISTTTPKQRATFNFETFRNKFSTTPSTTTSSTTTKPSSTTSTTQKSTPQVPLASAASEENVSKEMPPTTFRPANRLTNLTNKVITVITKTSTESSESSESFEDTLVETKNGTITVNPKAKIHPTRTTPSPTQNLDSEVVVISTTSTVSTRIEPSVPKTRYVTQSDTKTVEITDTEISILTQSDSTMTRTILITKTIPPGTRISTIVGSITLVNTVDITPTTVRSTIFSEPTATVPTSERPPTTVTTAPTSNIFHAGILTKKITTPAPTSKAKTNSSKKIHPYLMESSGCGKLNCSLQGNQMCKINHSNIALSKCICKPGYARMKQTGPCRPTYTYSMKLSLHPPPQSDINYKDLMRSGSDPYNNFIFKTKDAIDRAFGSSDIKRQFQGSEVMGIEPIKLTEEPSNPMKVNVDFLVQLTVNMTEERIKNHLIRTLKGADFSIGRSGLVATKNMSDYFARDFDECTSEDYNDCSKNAECINVRGSFSCQCKSGFKDKSKRHKPGRECTEIAGCGECHFHGNCYVDQFGNPACDCFRWYGGAECQINLKVLLLSIIGIGTILLILVALCGIILCRRKKGNRERSGSGRFMRYRSPTHATLERTAIMHDEVSSTSSSSETLASEEVQHPHPHVSRAPGGPNNNPQQQHSYTPDSLLGEHNDNMNQFQKHSGDSSGNLMNFSLRNVVMDQDRSLTVVIPRAKIRPNSRPGTTTSLGPDPNADLASTERKLINYLENGASGGVGSSGHHRAMSSRHSTLQRGGSHGRSNSHRKLSLQERRVSSGALVSSGTEVSARGGMRRRSTGLEPDMSTFNSRNYDKTISDMRSYDETTVRSHAKHLGMFSTQTSRASCYSCKPPSYCAYSESVGHTMAEKDGSSTVYTTQGKLFRMTNDSDSNISSD